jgi:flagellar biosynthesis protein FlhG
MKPLAEQDHYETLDLPRGATPEAIERAYRLACSTYCEDSLAGYPVFEEGDVALLRERIEVAYRVLTDPEAREVYDRSLEAEEVAPAGPTSASSAREPGRVAMKPEVLEPLDALGELDDVDADDGEWSGARLRRTRLRQGVEIEDVAKVTKVNPTYLRFIEDEHFEGLPAVVYVRGFVSGLASVLGLDARRVASSYVARYEERKGGSRRRLFSRR